eukprot:CAMPEP_0182937936 /NCGR_PEP_ID=MMETSP0105_2-20130417/42986_1 /TAXON_ID=81532 ORGANISM="Acanthoeca-like sp., Strain 10tr" /NCGR_SAMPLE_ID=MMETSP0105_2 /ASSEMBLY_ACC=CAM_ASM_000205 /LENGTH=30 /DNA_ID= /DNA_START= /DNA_END= /DNA_ORIENTATION=
MDGSNFPSAPPRPINPGIPQRASTDTPARA